jgi:hypothetical protein
MMTIFIVDSIESKRDPKGYHRHKVKPVEGMPKKCPARKTIPLLLAAMA